MLDLTALQLLLIVNLYLLLALAVFGLSASDLLCRLGQRAGCAKRRRGIKALIAVPLVLSCLGLLATGLFAIGLSHGSRPEDYQVALFVFACLLPVLLLIIWALGSLWLDGLWVALISVSLTYLLLVQPALYVRFWADTNIPWAQVWMAEHYESGRGGLEVSAANARRWYEKAAVSGHSEAQYRMGGSARRNSEAVKWYLAAAEQGHVEAMVQMARLGRSDQQRQQWLKQALAHQHPEALLLQARQAMATDLPLARRLLVEAAEKGSRTAILMLITEYRQGGVLFALNQAAADGWLAVLRTTPVASTEPGYLTSAYIEQTLAEAEALGARVQAEDPKTLYTQARAFLSHPAKDAVLHALAVSYLQRAANQHYGDASLELAKQALASGPMLALNTQALDWYKLAAQQGNRPALMRMIRHYKDQPTATAEMLRQALAYNEQLLELLPQGASPRELVTRQHWAGELRDTRKQLAQLERLGGSWQTAITQANKDPGKEYLLAKELLKNGQFAAGMQHLESAAQRNSPDARLELATRTLRGPRSYTEEIAAVSELQLLDRQGVTAASLALASHFQSGTGILPRNYYLARHLFRKALADPVLAERAQRWLSRVPDMTDSLLLNAEVDLSGQIENWYRQILPQMSDKAMLRGQYEALKEHFADQEALKQRASEDDAVAQYQLAQTLQSHNLAEAMAWLRLAAINGNVDAMYELAVRMIRGKKNTPKQQAELARWAHTAADHGHIGAMAFLASQYRNGYGGFTQDTSKAKAYYQRALSASDQPLLFVGRVAGREVRIERTHLENALTALDG